MAARRSGFRRTVGMALVLLVMPLLSMMIIAPVNAAQVTTSVATKPLYKFTVEVAMATATANRNGGYAASIAKYLYQWNKINAQFNAGGGLNATYLFSIVEGHEFFDTTADELARPHPTTNLKVIYDEDAVNVPGGWNRNEQTIVYDWRVSQGGSFASWGTDALVHELGHYRGATDEYACNVDDPTKNPVNGATYRAPTSIMGTTYDARNWSAYSSGLINMQGARTDEPRPSLASKALPPLQVRARSNSGQPVAARIRFYPVNWYALAVAGAPVVDRTTSISGYYKFASNPFKPTAGADPSPWNVTYCGFLVSATYKGKTVFNWLSLAAVGASYFKSKTTPYTHEIRF